MLIRTRAPVRIDFAGGWTDVALFTETFEGVRRQWGDQPIRVCYAPL